MTIGLGTGSTTFFAVESLAKKLGKGELKDVKVVPCSVETKKHCISLGIPVTTLSTCGKERLDLTIDGADEVDSTMSLIKGKSGALLREKMVENASDRVIIIVDEDKLVKKLGPGKPLPIEIVPWDHEYTLKAIEMLPSLQGKVRALLRTGSVTNEVADGIAPAVTDNGNFVVDCYFSEPIGDVSAAAFEVCRA